jgi:hypothetical protein
MVASLAFHVMFLVIIHNHTILPWTIFAADSQKFLRLLFTSKSHYRFHREPILGDIHMVFKIIFVFLYNINQFFISGLILHVFSIKIYLLNLYLILYSVLYTQKRF